MMIRHGAMILAMLSTVCCTPARAGAGHHGTSDEQKACRHDVVRHCRQVAGQNDDFAVLHCLQANRQHLSKACVGVLESHGQ